MIKIGIAAVVGSLLVMQLKNLKAEYGQLLLMALGLLLLYIGADRLTSITTLFQKLTDMIEVQKTYVAILLKMVGIAYICEFASNLCKDAGCQTIAGEVEMLGKLSILLVSLPVMTALVETITGLL